MWERRCKISVSSSAKIDKYEYLTNEEMLPRDQSKTIDQVRFTYFWLGRYLKNK